MSPLTASLYILCILFLTVFSVFVLAKNPKDRLNQLFFWLSLALLGWVASLFAFIVQTSPSELLWLGRFNFAAVAFAVPLVYLFTREVAGRKEERNDLWIWAETALLGAGTLFGPAVDASDAVPEEA